MVESTQSNNSGHVIITKELVKEVNTEVKNSSTTQSLILCI